MTTPSIARPLQRLATALLCLCAAAIVWLPASAAEALIPVELSDITYAPCPAELSEGMVGTGSSSAAKCVIVSGKTTNKSGKPVKNADIFGRIFDATHNTVFPNRNRIGSIEYVDPGEGEFSFQITVEANLKEPLQFEGFKASGFKGRVRR